MNKLLLPVIWILSLFAVFFLTSSFEKNTTHFYGLAENHEQAVRFQEPVEITHIDVIEGQFVERGQVLLRAKRSELQAQKIQLSNQMDELNARQKQTAETLSAEIRVLNAKRSAELAKLDAQIQHLQGKYQQDIALYQSITGSLAATSGVNMLAEEIRSLRDQKAYLSRSVNSQISALRTQISASKMPLVVQKNQLKERLGEIERQTDELTIRADFTGRIGSILFKEGEKIPAFQSVLTVHAPYPKFVKGFIHENVSNDVKIGQTVWVHALSSKDQQAVKGRVESLGSRIVPYPERLRKNAQVQSWGREVNIRLTENNPLLLGEKVQVSFSPDRPNTASAFFKPFGQEIESMVPSAFAHGKGVNK